MFCSCISIIPQRPYTLHSSYNRKTDKQGTCTDVASQVLNAAHNMIPIREEVIND